jgi:hypothetical protein
MARFNSTLSLKDYISLTVQHIQFLIEGTYYRLFSKLPFLTEVFMFPIMRDPFTFTYSLGCILLTMAYVVDF